MQPPPSHSIRTSPTAPSELLKRWDEESTFTAILSKTLHVLQIQCKTDFIHCYSLFYYYYYKTENTLNNVSNCFYSTYALCCKNKIPPRSVCLPVTNFLHYTQRKRKKVDSVQSWVSLFYSVSLPLPKEDLPRKNISLHQLRASVAVCYVLFPFLSSNLYFRVNLQPLGTTLQTVLRLGFIIPELQPVTNTLAAERKFQSPFLLIFCPVHWKWHMPSNYSI